MIERVPLDAEGHVDLHHALRALAARGITRVFSEGGPLVAARLIALGLADEVALITAEKPLGRPGVPALDAEARAALARPSRYRPVERLDYGPDTMRIWGRVDGPGGAVRSLARSVWIFLALGSLFAENPDYGGWICLDFLGFSRPNRDLSMGYAGKAQKNFFRRLPAFQARGRVPSHSERRIVHGPSLMGFWFTARIVVRPVPLIFNKTHLEMTSSIGFSAAVCAGAYRSDVEHAGAISGISEVLNNE